jgi:tRNA (cmo5U34)-methyltransferase
MRKLSVDEIRARFDADVDRFSNLATGQTATVDARLSMDLIVQAAARCTPHARDVLDIGCGAGNFSLRLLQEAPGRNITLVDLSHKMLDRAVSRVQPVTSGTVVAIQGDLRDAPWRPAQYDVLLAAMVLHHLRTDAEWEAAYRSMFAAVRPGGSLWVFDLVASASPPVESLMQERYSEYLVGFRGPEFRDEVFAYIEREDTPRPLVEQLDRLRAAGFEQVDVLHKHACFAAFGGRKPSESRSSSTLRATSDVLEAGGLRLPPDPACGRIRPAQGEPGERPSTSE